MSQNTSKLQKEYFTACFVAMFTAIIGLAAPDSSGQPPVKSQFLVFFIAAILIVIGSMVHIFRKTADNQTEEDLLHRNPRLRRMTLLWYGLSLVLAALPVFRSAHKLLRNQMDLIAAIEWIVGAACAAVIAFSLWRIALCLFGSESKKGKRILK
jgi:1,4-dihydroxy-2-naphthoate octaprenyltransferase